ncbi:hypothetical protein ACJBU6_07305 [Exserohilum turcicum]
MDVGNFHHTTYAKVLSTQKGSAEWNDLRPNHSSVVTAGDQSAPDLEKLDLDSGKGSAPNSPPSGRKRTAEHETYSQRGKASPHIHAGDSDYSGKLVSHVTSDKTRQSTSSPHQSTPEPSSEWSAEATNSTKLHSSQPESPVHPQQRETSKSQDVSRQLVFAGHPQHDECYPDLLLHLALEAKSIYAGLAMVEKMCIQVDRAQAAAVQHSKAKLPPDHWQELIALHTILLNEHRNFFLASQHPSASSALRQLAAKHSMPARMWKHGIHSFLELLQQHLPESIDYMLQFYLFAHQMMALLHKKVPEFEDTWKKYLDDLDKYYMATEDEMSGSARLGLASDDLSTRRQRTRTQL